MAKLSKSHAIILALAAAGWTATAPAQQVRTTTGMLSGGVVASGLAYKGVPYAAPPVGPLRWRSPHAAKPWKGVRTATSFGAPCAQSPLRGMTQVSDLSREDCLYLNVWTPAPQPGVKLPVMVWIHGGGFVNGSGSSATYDGARFSAKGVILVTLNYRLGVFGFLSHSALAAESAHKSSGNFGLEDQIAALRWVRANIAAFGGDASNVTIFGQSAGGASVLDLAASPLAKGLFGKAIVQSGAARDAIVPAARQAAERSGTAFAGSRTIGQLRALDTAAVLKLADSAPRDIVRFSPSIDGYVLRDHPLAALRSRKPKLPLLIGSNSREGLGTPEPGQLEAAVKSAFGANADRALHFYANADNDALLGTPAQQFATDSTFRCGTVQTAAVNAAAGAPTWQYQFEQSVPGREQVGAAHSVEVPYVFGTLSSTGYSAANYADGDRRLSDRLIGYWANFAITGNPNGPGLPDWPAYRVDRRVYLRFSSALPNDAQVAADLRGDLCRLFPIQARGQ